MADNYDVNKANQRHADTKRDDPPSKAPPTSSSVNQGAVGQGIQLRKLLPDEAPPRFSDSHDSETTRLTTDDDVDQPAKTKFSYHQIITILSAALANFANMAAYSIIAVFYPIQAKEKGLSQTAIGLVFSSFAFTFSIGSPIWGKILPLVGARFMFLSGAFVTGGCSVLFGFMDEMPSEATFIVFSFVIRALEGLGSSASVTASSVIVAFNFPAHVGTAVSLVEMIGGLAFALGPAIGGAIYSAAGFKLPFFILGGFVLVIDVVNFCLLPEQESRNDETGSVIQVLSIPAIWIALLTTATGSIVLAIMEATLSLHLEELDFTVIEISLMFVCSGMVYALTSVLCGYIADVKKVTRIMLLMGACGCGVFLLLLGPSPLLKIPSTKLLAILSIPLGASSGALTVMPTLVDMFISAELYGIPSGLGLTSVISGLWGSAFAIGTTLGPFIGGALTDQFGFAYATTIIACACAVVTLIICFFGVWEYRCGKGRRLQR